MRFRAKARAHYSILTLCPHFLTNYVKKHYFCLSKPDCFNRMFDCSIRVCRSALCDMAEDPVYYVLANASIMLELQFFVLC